MAYSDIRHNEGQKVNAMRSHRKETVRQQGMSLVEALVGITLFTAIILAALLIYDRSNKMFKQGVEAAESQQNTRVAFDRMTSDLRMAGFDFDRDGVPTSNAAFQQPDEQFEFLGRSALTVRGNYDYQTNPENGRECVADVAEPWKCQPNTGLESTQFPVVTTGNDEIVTYGLVSNSGPNNDVISFFADVPDRKAHDGPGGRIEAEVRIRGVDFSNASPPYTLYRFTLAPGNAVSVVRTPLANNIRSLTFDYYEDPAGSQPLTDLSAAAIVPATIHTTVGGLGVVDPANPVFSTPRALREKVQSVRMVLIGMNEAPDNDYNDPGETIPAVSRYRKYRLDTLISPRNFQRRGMREQDTTEPGVPIVRTSCNGYCGAVYFEWDAPGGGGGVESYNILYDTDNVGGFAQTRQFGNQLSAVMVLPDPSATYYFAVQAVNSFGQRDSTTLGPYTVRNATVPVPPVVESATVDAALYPQTTTGVIANTPQASQITLTWIAPTGVASGNPTCALGSVSTSQLIEELDRWIVERSTNPAFPAPQTTTRIVTPSSYDPIDRRVTWTDTPVSNCVPYYYRIRTREKCASAANRNVSNDVNSSISAVSNVLVASATSATAPAPVATFQVVQGAPTTCNGVRCDVGLSWAAVTADTTTPTPLPIQVEKYRVHRKQSLTGNPTVLSVSDQFVTSANGTFTASTVEFLDTNVFQFDGAGIEYVYDYSVFALQCELESTSSAIRRFPCNFGGGTMTIAVGATPSPTDGTGAQGDPWVVNTPADLTIQSTGGSMQRVAVNWVDVGTGLATPCVGCNRTGPFTTITLPIPTVADGTVIRGDITLVDATGCTRTVVRYVSDSPTNCCLSPQSFDGTVVRFVQTAGSTDIVEILLKNICDEPLTILNPSVTIRWDPLRLSGSPRRLSSVSYPASLGTTPTLIDTTTTNSTGTPVLSTRPGGSLNSIASDTVAPNDEYRIRVKFSRSFAQNPITSFCVNYQRVSDGIIRRTCRVIPDPSPTADTCP